MIDWKMAQIDIAVYDAKCMQHFVTCHHHPASVAMHLKTELFNI